MNIEDRIKAVEKELKRGGEFKELCEAVLKSPDGQALLALLCAVANPVDHTFCADERLSAHLAGNREVVALLWRYGACTNSVPEPQNT